MEPPIFSHTEPICDSPFIASESLPFVFIDKIDDTYHRAILEIASNSIIAVDCEGKLLTRLLQANNAVIGVALGRNGKVCLLQIATEANVFLFDVQTLGASLFSLGLKAILEYHSPSKIFYDCRKDSDALFHQFDIRLKGEV
jgi:hypothetical protein